MTPESTFSAAWPPPHWALSFPPGAPGIVLPCGSVPTSKSATCHFLPGLSLSPLTKAIEYPLYLSRFLCAENISLVLDLGNSSGLGV